MPSDKRLNLDDDVHGRGDLLADGPRRQVQARHQDHVLDTGEGVTRRVGVDRAERALVTGVHRLHHVEGLGAADLTDDDAVGAHTQGVAHEVALGDLAAAFEARRARFQRDDVRLLQPELRRVLDRDDALGVRDVAGERVEQRRLTGTGTAGDDRVELGLDAGAQELGQLRASWCRRATRSSIVILSWRNFRIVIVGLLGATGGTMMFTREPSGRRASTIGDDSSTRRPSGARMRSMMRDDVVVVAEADRAEVEPAFLFEVDRVRRVDHDFRNGRVLQQRLDRAEAEDLVGDRGDQLVTAEADDAGHLRGDERARRAFDNLAGLFGSPLSMLARGPALRSGAGAGGT